MESNVVGMIDERMVCKMEISKGRKNNNKVEKDFGSKGKKKEFIIKEYRDKNIIIINIKIDYNEF